MQGFVYGLLVSVWLFVILLGFYGMPGMQCAKQKFRVVAENDVWAGVMS